MPQIELSAQAWPTTRLVPTAVVVTVAAVAAASVPAALAAPWLGLGLAVLAAVPAFALVNRARGARLAVLVIAGALGVLVALVSALTLVVLTPTGLHRGPGVLIEIDG